MANLALFDVVIPVVIGWVLVDDLMRSMANAPKLKPVVDNIISLKQGSFKLRRRGVPANNLVVTQGLAVIEEKRETCSLC